MPFVGRIGKSNIDKLVYRAIQKGCAKSGNREAAYQGEAQLLETVYGVFCEPHGTFKFRYYNSSVLAVDLDNRRITDFGMSGYSKATDMTVCAYMWALNRLFPSVLHRNLRYDLSYWTNDLSRSCNKRQWQYPGWDAAPVFERLRAGVPWCEKDGGTWWLLLDKFNGSYAGEYRQSIWELQRDHVWRWFTLDWVNGVWMRVFIDADAERRYNQTQERKKAA